LRCGSVGRTKAKYVSQLRDSNDVNETLKGKRADNENG